MIVGNFVTEYQKDATRIHFHKLINFTLLGPSSELDRVQTNNLN